MPDTLPPSVGITDVVVFGWRSGDFRPSAAATTPVPAIVTGADPITGCCDLALIVPGHSTLIFKTGIPYGRCEAGHWWRKDDMR